MRTSPNAARDRGTVAPVDDAAWPFHTALPGYRPSPLRVLADVAAELGVGALAVKDESGRLGLPSFKALGASWAIEQTVRADPHVREVVTASAGNHGRAVAHFAGRRGLACRIFLPERTIAARRAAIAGEGADVVVVDGTYEDAVAEAAAAGRQPGVAEVADVGTSPAAHWVIDGYATLFAELPPEDEPDVLLVPVGVGSLAAAAARWAARREALVVGVEPDRAACLSASLRAGRPTAVHNPGTTMAGLDCAEVSPAAWADLRGGVHATITVSDAEAAAAKRAYAAHGMSIGSAGAATLAGLRALATDPACAALRATLTPLREARVLLLATEGDTDG